MRGEDPGGRDGRGAGHVHRRAWRDRGRYRWHSFTSRLCLIYIASKDQADTYDGAFVAGGLGLLPDLVRRVYLSIYL